MPNVLTEADIDPIADSVDAMMDAADEARASGMHRFNPEQQAPDLSNGGTVNGVNVRPTREKAKRGDPPKKGRPAARRAWMWNGTETLLPLAWNPDGTMHDGGRRYLLKRHCLCCHTGGFRARQCPNCVKTNCDQCGGSSEPKKIIPNFYLRKEDVPFQEKFFGNVNCFMPFCARRGGRGFKTEQDMRVHARTRHRMEYQAHMEGIAASRTDELDSLRRRLDAMQGPVAPAAVATAPQRAKRPSGAARAKAKKAASIAAA